MEHTNADASFYNIPFEIDSFNGMPFRALGKSGLYVSDIGLGAWKIGYPEKGDGARIGEKQAFELFERAIDLGITFWDTANRYNNASGNSERVIGTWLKSNPSQRRNVVLSTKISGAMDGLTPNHCGLSRSNILDSVYACLDRLGISHIDLLFFHSFDPNTALEESLMAIEDLVRQDLVRYFGVSNFSVENLEACQAIHPGMTVRSRIVAIQNQFDLLNGESASYKGVLEYARQIGASFIGWSPLARGLLTEKYLDIASVGKGDRLVDEGLIGDKMNDSVGKILNRLAALARQWDMKLNQLALAYLLAIPGMGPVIPSSVTVSQLESNAAAGRIRLNKAQMGQVEQALQ